MQHLNTEVVTYEEWIIELNKPIIEVKDAKSSQAEAEAEMALFWGAKSTLNQ